MRCDQCKHWGMPKLGDEYEDGDYGSAECAAVPFRYDATANIKYDTWEERLKLERNFLVAARAFTVDGSGYSAALYTFPDFGCVKFEPIEPQEQDG